MPQFGSASQENLKNVDPRLVELHNFVIQHYDHTITDGIRTVEEQRKNVAKGVSKTMESKHLPDERGLSKATDSHPHPAPNWRLVEKCLDTIRTIDPTLSILRFYHFQGFMLGAATHMGHDLRQGIDWNENTNLADQTFFDLPHNEIK